MNPKSGLGGAGEPALERFAGWLVPLYVASMGLVFLGEHVLESSDQHSLVSGAGALGAVVATALLFAAALRHQGERRRVERALGLVAVGGLLALALYAATTDTGTRLLGVATATPEVKARFASAGLVVWVSILVLALLPLVFGEAALSPMRRAPQIESRRVRMALRSGTILAVALVYCGLFTYAAGELDSKVDFSYFRTGRPSESTKNLVAGLTEPIKVMAFFPPLNEVGTEVDGYLHDLGSAGKVTVESYDRLMVPALAKEAKVTQDGVIVMTRGPAHETLVVGSELKNAAAKLKSLDGDVQKALLKLMREQRTAYLTVGHGELNQNQATGDPMEERTAKRFRKLLESQNYVVKDLGMAQGLATDVPADAYLVVMLGPSQAPLPAEVAALGRFAERGGKLLLALDPDAKVDLAPLAATVELTWKPTVVVNDKVYVRQRSNPSDRANMLTNRFSSHPSVSTLSRSSQQAAVLFLRASSLGKRDGATAKVDLAAHTLADAFEDTHGDFTFDAAAGRREAFTLAAAVSKPVSGAPAAADPKKGTGKEATEMRAFVVADADCFADLAMNNEWNLVFAVDALRWLGGEESFSGSITTNEDVRVEHTKQKDTVWFYATILGAPGLVLGFGLLVTRKRRRPAPARAAAQATPAPEEAS